MKAYGTDLRLFLNSWGEVEDVDMQAGLWLNEGRRTWTAQTTRRRSSAIRGFARFRGVVVLHDYSLPSPPRPRPNPLPGGMDTVDACIKACHDEFEVALVILCGKMGLRISEAAALQEIDSRDRTVLVQGKGDRWREVPVPDQYLVPLLYAQVSGGEGVPIVNMGYTEARDRLGYIARRIGLKGVTSHQYRATAATHWHASGASLRTVQELLGHAQSTTTEVYTAVTMDAMREAVA